MRQLPSARCWSIPLEHVHERFVAAAGTDPIFRSDDGSNCEGVDDDRWRSDGDAQGLRRSLVHVSSADATIACWLVTYTEQSWRPQTAITTSFDDGNPATETDPTWQPFGATPNHPEYPSGHACSTGAITTALRHFFGTDEFTFTVESPAPGLTQNFITYSRFSDAENDVNLSRIYLGIHFWGAQVDGTRLGERIGQQVHSRAFKPTLDLAEYVGSGAVSRRSRQLWEALSSPPIASRTMRGPAMSR